jgi:hypothetical protein
MPVSQLDGMICPNELLPSILSLDHSIMLLHANYLVLAPKLGLSGQMFSLKVLLSTKHNGMTCVIAHIEGPSMTWWAGLMC